MGEFWRHDPCGCAEKSVNNSFDVLIADLKAKEAENYINSSLKDQVPSLTLGGSLVEANPARINYFGEERNTAQKSIGFLYLPLEFSYEFDFWGIRSGQRAYAKANRDFAEFEKNYVILSTLSNVSALYFNILNNENIISLYEEIAELKRQKIALSNEKLELGLATSQEIIELQKELAGIESKKTLLKAKNEELKNKFYLFVSGDKERTPVVFKNIDDINVFYTTSTEFGTERIANRPDILMAEKKVRMAQLDVSEVKRSLLPRFVISGNVYHLSRTTNDFFDSENTAYRISGGVLHGIFHKKKNLCVLNAKKNAYRRVLKEYEKVIATSINDVNNSLFYLKSCIKNYNQAKTLAENSIKYMNNEKEKLDMRIITLETFIDAQEKYINSKIAESESKTECLVHTISLYKALGGNV